MTKLHEALPRKLDLIYILLYNTLIDSHYLGVCYLCVELFYVYDSLAIINNIIN